MNRRAQEIEALERRFWDALVDEDAQSAIDLLADTALIVGAHGTRRFGHDDYRRMVAQGPMVLKAYQMGPVDVLFPTDTLAIASYAVTQEVAPRGEDRGVVQHVHDTSTWVREGSRWRCVAHTETPAHVEDHAATAP